MKKFTLSNSDTEWHLQSKLNEEQLQIATAPPTPALVVAGAGSGKTRALTYRIAWLVEHGVDPGNILLMTFTNRAARDMLRRIEELLSQEIRSVWGGTFHHIGNRILRLYGAHIGLDPDFTIIDRDDSKSLIKNCIDDLNPENTSAKRFPAAGVLNAVFSFARNTMRPLDEVLEEDYPEFHVHFDSIRKVLEDYRRRKRRAMLLDFDDLLCLWLQLMREHDEVRQLLSSRFQHVLVDEYQDTNAVQDALVECLVHEHGNICVVGDDSQSIYSFRGALFENIIQFRTKFEDTKIYRLETNYRSTPEILALANASITHNTRRLEKQLKATKPTGQSPFLGKCPDQQFQARFIAQYIRRLLDEHTYSPADVAVLYRSHWHSLEIQLEFQRWRIPFTVRGGLRFFEQAHIKDILAYLRVLHNPRDETGWQRILRHVEGVGEKTAQKIWLRLSSAENPLQELQILTAGTTLPRKKREAVQELAETLVSAAGEAEEPADTLRTVHERFYLDFLFAVYENADSRREDVEATIEFAERYEEISAFLTDVTLATEEPDNRGGKWADKDDDSDKVILSTVHQAKGLEWDVVFIPWLTEGNFPVDFGGRKEVDIEEERRIFHVAVTRAGSELYLLFPITAKKKGGHRYYLQPSRFISELPPDLLEPLIIEDDKLCYEGSSPSNNPYENAENSVHRLKQEQAQKPSGQPDDPLTDEPYYEYLQDD